MNNESNEIYDVLLLRNQGCFPVYAVANKILRRYQPLLKEINLTYTQYITMMVLWEKEAVREKDLVDALFLKANTLTDLLRNLKKKGYIDVSKDENDKRSITISLTEEGRELKKRAVNIPKCIEGDHWLTNEEFIVFRKLLDKMLKGDW